MLLGLAALGKFSEALLIESIEELLQIVLAILNMWAYFGWI